MKIKVYVDSGANIKYLKKYSDNCVFFQFPYDSPDRPKKNRPEIAMASQLQWRDFNTTWEETDFSWESMHRSSVFPQILNILGKSNRRDALHLDSAYKHGVQLFLTSDKKDIWRNRKELERICNFNIFCSSDEMQDIIAFIEGKLSQISIPS